MARIHVENIPPLLAFHSERFAEYYQQGLWWSLYGEREGKDHLPDSYLVHCLETCVAHNWFDGKRQDYLEWWVGFAMGMIHGGILTPQGTIRLDVGTPVLIQDQEFKRGYDVGRPWFFEEATPEERTYVCSDTGWLERLTGLVQGNMTHFIDGKGDYLIWWSGGSYLGELSGAVFPMLERYTEPLEVLPRPEMAY